MPDIDFQHIELNIIPKQGDEPVVFYASQFETARPFIADLFWGESEFAPGDDCWAEIDIRKVDDNLVVITDDVSIDNNVVSVVLPIQAVTCVGDNFGQIKIYAAVDNLVATLNFILRVQPDPLAGGVTSETAIENLATQIEEIAQEVIGENYYDKTEVDTLLADKADADDVYTKAETDTLLSAKADISSLATVATTGDYDDLINKPTIPDEMSELTDVQITSPDYKDALFYDDVYQKWFNQPAYTKADIQSFYYDKTAVDTALSAKADASSVYTKAQVDGYIQALLPEVSASGAVASINVDLLSRVSYTADENATKIMKTSGDATIAEYIKYIFNGTYDFVDLGSLSWIYDSGMSRFYSTGIQSIIKAPVDNNHKANMMLYGYDVVTLNELYSSANMTYACSGSAIISIKNTSYTDPDDFKAAVSGLYLIFERQTATTPSITDTDFDNICTSFNINGETYTLSDVIETYFGYNNFFGDVGDISLSAKDTIQHYIDERT